MLVYQRVIRAKKSTQNTKAAWSTHGLQVLLLRNPSATGCVEHDIGDRFWKTVSQMRRMSLAMAWEQRLSGEGTEFSGEKWWGYDLFQNLY